MAEIGENFASMMTPTEMTETRVRPADARDAEAIARIYNHYIVDTAISFEEQAVSPAEMAERILEVQAVSLPWLVAERDGRLIGYAYASKWKGRCAYRHSVESTIYLEAGLERQGIGNQLYGALMADLRERSIHVVIGGIAQPNPACVALHERLGFEKVAHFREVGYKFGRWIDVAYWQKAL
jgi:phosphinothricin acetyltransferase